MDGADFTDEQIEIIKQGADLADKIADSMDRQIEVF